MGWLDAQLPVLGWRHAEPKVLRVSAAASQNGCSSIALFFSKTYARVLPRGLARLDDHPPQDASDPFAEALAWHRSCHRSTRSGRASCRLTRGLGTSH